MNAPVRSKFSAAVALCLGALAATPAAVRAEGGGVAEVKSYLTGKAARMDGAAHDYVKNAEQYQKIVDASGGD